MKNIIFAILTSLSLAACNSSPQAIEAQKFEQIRQEQQREHAEYDKYYNSKDYKPIIIDRR